MCIKAPAVARGGRRTLPPGRRESGLTLFELIFFMVIVSVALAGILSVMNLTTRHSADPLQRKQALAIAEAILEEVQLLPVAEPDPCAGLGEAQAACRVEQAATPGGGARHRNSAESPFMIVDDYNGLELQGSAAGGNPAVAIPAGYDVSVAVEKVSLGPAGAEDSNARQITVAVAYGNGRESMVLQGYRGSYDAPEAT